MSQERVVETLMSFGLTRMDARIYVLIAKKGPQKAIEIGRAFKTSKPQLYRSLKNLESRGIVHSTLEHPARFSALPFEKALDLLAKAKMKKALEEAQQIQETKDDLLANWKTLNVGEYKDASAKFTVVEGRNNIYARIQQMIMETRNQVSTMTTVQSLIRADQFGLFDINLQHPLNSRVKFRFLTEMSEQNVPQMKNLLDEIKQAGISFEGRNPDLGLRLFPRMVIRDEDEILFFIKSTSDLSVTEQDNSCIWTNCRDLVKAFIGIFEQMWRNSTDIEKKIEDIEAGKLVPKTYVIEDVETAKKKYHEFLNSAKERVLILTSSQGLFNYSKDIESLKTLVEKHVSVRIMVPLTNQNLNAAQQLSGCCEVRHVPVGNLGATLVDGKHLFQFTSVSSEEMMRSETLYTSDPEYVGRMNGILDSMWQNASTPSTATLETILKPVPFTGGYPEVDSVAVERIRKEDENKLHSKSGWFGHAIIGRAIIHPPSHLNLPDIMIHVKKIMDDASFGGHDVVAFFLRLPSPSGERFVPVGIINNGERSIVMEKVAYADTPAAQNLLLVKREELEIWKQGNTLFAGWTVPIPLPPTKYILPPSCILFDGVGETQHHEGTRSSLSSGHKTTFAGDAQEAFVTFINPTLSYVGPGTDGCLAETSGIVVTGNGKSKLPPATTMEP